MEPNYANTEDAAVYLRVSTATLRMWVRSGKLPESCWFKLGNTYRFNISKLDQYLAGDLDDPAVAAQKKEEVAEQPQEPEEDAPEQLEFEFVRADDPRNTGDTILSEPQVTNYDSSVDEDF